MPSIFIDDKRNTTANAPLYNNGTIDVVQLVLSDRLTFYHSFYYYKSNNSTTSCGNIIYKWDKPTKLGVINYGPDV